MKYSNRSRDALALAFDLHKDQQRKCGGTPYITHLLAVAALVGEYGGSEDQFIAALLHDAVEDQGGKVVLTQIRDEFGDEVAELVWACTDAWGNPKPPWRMRKEAHIARIPGSPIESRLIIAADKIHNIQSMLRTYTPDDDKGYWRNFKGRRDGTLWYYEAMGKSLRKDWLHRILGELGNIHRNFLERIGV